MGKEKKSKKKSSSSSVSRASSPASKFLALLKYVSKGRVSKIKKWVKRDPDVANTVDSSGQTLLHKACMVGNVDVADVLLRSGCCKLSQRDRDGNTAVHMAALHRHLTLVAHLLKQPDKPDIKSPNAAGLTIERLVATVGAPNLLGAPTAAAGEASKAASFQHGSSGSGSEDEWRRRLREENSDADDGGRDESYGIGSGAAAAAETEDDWADRLWRDMQARRRQQARAASTAFTASLREAQEESARRAAASQEASRRILQEETKRDAEWRRRVLQPQLPDLATQRAQYEARWATLDASAASSSGPQQPQQLSAEDIPWPVPEHADEGMLRDVLLHGASGPADVKRRLRVEILRWHPDKFEARFGARLPPAASGAGAAVRGRVHAVSQLLTRLMSGGGATK